MRHLFAWQRGVGHLERSVRAPVTSANLVRARLAIRSFIRARRRRYWCQFDKPLGLARLLGFCLVWLALVVFTADLLGERRRQTRRAVLVPA